MQQYILAHDLGTSGNKATLFTTDGKLFKSVTVGYAVHYFEGNCVEQNPDDWWSAVAQATRTLLADVRPEQVLAVSFSGQMQGCVCVDKDGNVLRPSLIWADLRAEQQTRHLLQELDAAEIYRITGQRISPAHTLQKLMWVRDNQPDIYAKTYKVLQSKDYIILKLTGRFVTDYSDAGGTNCFDIRSWKWSQTVLDASGIAADKLPDVLASSDIAGTVTPQAEAVCGLLAGTPVVCGGGDAGTSATGACCVSQGDAYACMGTSAWISYASGMPVEDPQMRTSNFVHLIPHTYLPLGNMNACGSSYNWMKSELAQPEAQLAAQQGISIYEAIDRTVAQSVPGSDALLYLPYLFGERCPYWDPDARGAFVGLKASHKHADMLRAVLEGVVMHLGLILHVLEENAPVGDLSVIGGGARGAQWMQMLADVLGKPLQTLNYIDEASSIGAAVAGGIGAGVFADYSAVREFVHPVRTYTPIPENVQRYAKLLPLFEQAYHGLRDVYRGLAIL